MFHNSYDNYNLIAYIKDGVLEVDYENGESFYDHPIFKESNYIGEEEIDSY